MKTFIKSINVVFSLLLVLGALIVAMLAFPVFGNKALIVRSGSMEPTIAVGSVIIVRDFGKVIPGDVVAFRSEKNKNTIITHRITSIEQEGARTFYKTKGDANDSVDGWQVSPKNVLGKTFLVVPSIGKLLTFARSELGLPLLIIVPAIVVILLEAVNIGSEIKKRRKKKEIQLENSLMKERPKNSFFYPSARTGFESKPNFSGLKILLPFLIGAFVVQNTFAFFSDTETSTGNFFAAAESFGSPTPTPSVTLTPTPTSTPTPSPTPSCSPCCGNNNNVVVVGGGAGSNTSTTVINDCTSNVNQSNNTNTNTTVNQSSSTGGNSSSSNSTSTTTTGSSTNSTTVTTTTSSNSN